MWPPSEFLIHTLLSVAVPSIAMWPSWPPSESQSLGVDHIRNFPVLRSSFAIEHHVVRLDQWIRQVVFGDDYMRRLAREPRLGLKRECPALLIAQIDAGEPFGGLHAVTAAFHIASCRADEPLRLQRSAAGIIETHALDNVHEAGGVMRGLHDALERVAAGTIEQETLLLVRAGHAC